VSQVPPNYPPDYPPTGPGPYGSPPAPVYLTFPAPQPKGNSIASLVLGLSSMFFGWTFLVPIVGLVLGIIGSRKEPAGKGLAVAGIIINSIMLVGWAIVLFFMIGIFTLLFTAGVSGVQSQ